MRLSSAQLRRPNFQSGVSEFPERPAKQKRSGSDRRAFRPSLGCGQQARLLGDYGFRSSGGVHGNPHGRGVFWGLMSSNPLSKAPKVSVYQAARVKQ